MAATPNAADSSSGDAPAQAPTLFERLMPVFQMICIWYLMQSVSGMFFSPAQHQQQHVQSGGHSMQRSSPSSSSVEAPMPPADRTPLVKYENAFDIDEPLNLRVYVSADAVFDFTQMDAAQEQEQLMWYEEDLTYNTNANPEREDGVWIKQLNITVDDHLRQNGSMYAHVFLTKDGYSPNPQDSAFDDMAFIYQSLELTAFRPRTKITKKRNLLEAKTEEEEAAEQAAADALAAEADDGTYLLMWKAHFAINVVNDRNIYSTRTPPPPFMQPFMRLDKASGTYLPVLYMNDFWVLEDDLLPVNASVTALPLEISYYPIHMYKFTLYTQMEQNFKNQEMTGASTKRDTDNMKKMVIDTNPYLLGITFAVSLLHSLFDFLAFKNDVSFWKNQKSLAGLSLRTIVLNTFFQLVIFLYLMDNDTSWMILVSSGVSLLIDIWKIKKAIVISRDEDNKLVISGVESYEESPTAEHDRVAVAHLSFVLYPLIVGQAFYTLTYGVHKGWYSWIISSLTSFVYAFGFIMMTPQLYINYKLKSVAHLPWRAMVYKSLNTFIDDLFAFVITMPWMHRLSCFRDDLIFFIYLYQRWIYPVDATRTNEFGQGPMPEEENKEPTIEAVAATASITEEETAKEEENEKVNGGSQPLPSTEYLMTNRSKSLEKKLQMRKQAKGSE